MIIDSMARKTTGLPPSDERLAGLWGTGPTASGATIDEESSLNISAVFCAVTILSDAMKAMGLFVYKRTGQSRAPATDHPSYRLLHRRPNPETNPGRFKKLMMSWVLLWGNARAEIERDRAGNPVALWPIHPSRVSTKRTVSGEIVHQVHSDGGGIDMIPDRDMLHFMGFSKDGISGISVVGFARESLGMTVAAETYGARFFGNNARPSVVIKRPAGGKPLSDKAADNIRRSWQEAQGGANIHKPALLEEGMDVTILSMPNDDAQFLETRQYQVVEVARWFNITPHKLKDLTHATFSNVEHLGIEHVGDSVMPWAIEIEEECDRKLLRDNEQDFFCEFLIDGLLRADIKTRNEALAIQRNHGIINADQWRQKENLNPIGGRAGELYWMPQNMADAGEEPKDEPPPAPPQMMLPPGADEPEEGEADGDDKVDAIRSSIAEAHKGLLAEVLGRMLRMEVNAKLRYGDKPEKLRKWRTEHELTVRSAIMPAMDSLAASLAGTLDTHDGWAEFVGEQTSAGVQLWMSPVDGSPPMFAAQIVDDFMVKAMEICG